MTRSLEAARAFYAEELRFTTHMRSPALRAAFAIVPRERFVGPGPWRVKSHWDNGAYWTTDDADPRHVYHDVLIALDESRALNNGQPSLWAFLLDKLAVAPGEHVLHLGCGTGYYTAILAELGGPGGKVTGFEIDPAIFARARTALQPWPQVDVRHADGAATALAPADAIVASAGATHPLAAWLDALKIGGRLMVPLTSTGGPGGMLLATRHAENAYAARFLSGAFFIDFQGARDAAASENLAAALTRDRGAGVRSLRRDAHAPDETCWLHGAGWCLSMREAPG